MNELNLNTNLVYTIPSSSELCKKILNGENPKKFFIVEFVSLLELAENTISSQKSDYLMSIDNSNFKDNVIKKGMTTNINMAVCKAFVNLYQAYKMAQVELFHLFFNNQHNTNSEKHKKHYKNCLNEIEHLISDISFSKRQFHLSFSAAYETIANDID